MVVSNNMGTQYRPPNIIVLTIGTPKKVPLILGNSHMCMDDAGITLKSSGMGIPQKGVPGK